MQDNQFDKLMDLYLKNQLSKNEKIRVDEWLRHITDERAFDRLPGPERDDMETRTFNELLNRIKPDTAKQSSSFILLIRLWLKNFMRSIQEFLSLYRSYHVRERS